MYATPHSWTPFGRAAAERGVIEPDLRKWDYRHQVLPQRHLSRWQLFAGVKVMELLFHFHPRRLWRLLGPGSAFRRRQAWWSLRHTGSVWRRSSSSWPAAYTLRVRSIADDLRAELRQEARRLSMEERIRLSLRLGEEGLERYRQAQGLDRETAVRLLQRRRQAGRTPSRCMAELIG